MESFGCVKCGKPVPFPQNTKPGEHYLLACPHCHFTNELGIGLPPQPYYPVGNPQDLQPLIGNKSGY